MKISKKYSIELLRFLFAVLIMFFHMQQRYEVGGFFKHGNIGVSFFFIVSGWFMVAHSEKVSIDDDMGKAVFKYILHRGGVIYIPFIVCWVGAYIYNNFRSHNSLLVWVENFVNSLPELLMIRMNGMSHISYLSQSWYLSAMIITILVCYPMLIKMRKNYCYTVAPALVIFLFGFMSYQSGALNGISQQFYIFTKGFLWSMAAMNLGVFMYGVKEVLNDIKLTILGDKLLCILGCLCIGISLMYAILPIQSSSYDFIVTIIMSVGVMIEINYTTIINKVCEKNWRFCLFLGKISLYMYLVHVTVMDFWNRALRRFSCDSQYVRWFGFIIVVGIAVFIVYRLSALLQKMCEHVKRKLIIQ